MNRIIILLTLSLPFLVGIHLSDTEALPYPYVVTSAQGQFYFKMLPDGEENPFLHKGSGTIYEVQNGEDKILWTVDDWYAFSTYLSEDGEYLVRLGNWPRGQEPRDDHLAIAFYRRGRGQHASRGKEIRSYSTKELIRDKTKVPVSVSHYEFKGDREGLDIRRRHVFELVTVDQVHYEFDIRTGRILAERKL